MNENYLGHFAHDIRTHLSAILAGTDALDESVRDRAEGEELLEVIRSNSRYLLELFNNILDLSRIDAGGMSVEQTECNPGQIAAEVVALTQSRAMKKGLNLSADCDGPIPQVICSDPLRIRQILLNVLDNAIKFTETGSVRLVLSADESSERLSFRVIDTGPGIELSRQIAIFDAFTQADSTTTRRYGGAGLGLTISKRLADLLDAQFTIESNPEEGRAGCVFVLAVPTGSMAGVAMVETIPNLVIGVAGARGAAAGAHYGKLEGVNVLLIDHRKRNQLLYSSMLKGAGARVTIAAGVNDAIEVLQADQTLDSFNIALLADGLRTSDIDRVSESIRHERPDLPIVASVVDGEGNDANLKHDLLSCILVEPVHASALISAMARLSLPHRTD